MWYEYSLQHGIVLRYDTSTPLEYTVLLYGTCIICTRIFSYRYTVATTVVAIRTARRILCELITVWYKYNTSTAVQVHQAREWA